MLNTTTTARWWSKEHEEQVSEHDLGSGVEDQDGGRRKKNEELQWFILLCELDVVVMLVMCVCVFRDSGCSSGLQMMVDLQGKRQ